MKVLIRNLLIILTLTLGLGTVVSAEMLDSAPLSQGGDPEGIWEADSLEVDVYATPTLRAAVSDLDLAGFVDGQISFDGSGYRFSYVTEVDISLTFLGGAIAVALIDTVSETGTYVVSDSSLILMGPTGSDTLGLSVGQETFSLIQEVPLGDFATLAASIDPEGGAPLAVLRLVKVEANGLSADFDGSGVVDFTDFLAFADRFGKQSGDAGFESRFDLNSDGVIGFTDFLVFASQFG